MDDLNFNVDDIINDVNAKIKSAEKMKRTKKALKQSLSLTLRTVPKTVNRQIILTRNHSHRKLQKRPMTSLDLS